MNNTTKKENMLYTTSNELVKQIASETTMQELLGKLSQHCGRIYIKAFSTAETVAGILEVNYELYHKYNNQITDIIRACLLLDIGYIQIPNQIVNKTSLLTIDEFNLIKTHPDLSAKIAKEYGYSKFVQEIILKHHERFDQTGYPKRLKLTHEDIASYIAAADVYSALTAPCPFRRQVRYSPMEALGLLKGSENYYFDSKTIDKLNSQIQII